MYCKNCGKQLPDGAQFCDGCGARQVDDGYSAQQVKSGYVAYTNGREPKPSVGFIDAIKMFFTKYADFNTRSRRSEYWWAFLFCTLAGMAAGMISKNFAGLWSLAALVPTIAISVRRLHDIGRPGTWYLLNLIPIVGSIILIV
jgi:hypothetical protein